MTVLCLWLNEAMPLLVSLISGVLWGILGSFVTYNLFGPFSWWAAPSGILIGYLVYRLSQPFYTKSIWVLIPVAILSTFVAVALFGLSLGLADLARGVPNNIAWAVIVQGMLACLGGLVFVPFLWLLFPLSFGNHVLIRFLSRRAQASLPGPRGDC